MKRVSNDLYKIEFFPTALANVTARQTKHLPVEWVKNKRTTSAKNTSST